MHTAIESSGFHQNVNDLFFLELKLQNILNTDNKGKKRRLLYLKDLNIFIKEEKPRSLHNHMYNLLAMPSIVVYVVYQDAVLSTLCRLNLSSG